MFSESMPGGYPGQLKLYRIPCNYIEMCRLYENIFANTLSSNLQQTWSVIWYNGSSPGRISPEVIWCITVLPTY